MTVMVPDNGHWLGAKRDTQLVSEAQLFVKSLMQVTMEMRTFLNESVCVFDHNI